MVSRLSIFTLSLVLLGGTVAAGAQPVRATLKPEPDIAAEPAPKPAPKAAVTDKKAKADKDAKPAKAPPKRRAVLQQIDPVRPIGSAAPEPYRPTLTPPAPVAGLPPQQPSFGLPSAIPAPPRTTGPVQLNCDAGGCTDMNGTRYQGGVGTTLLDGQGRTCTRMGNTAQCF